MAGAPSPSTGFAAVASSGVRLPSAMRRSAKAAELATFGAGLATTSTTTSCFSALPVKVQVPVVP
jgi:hypothetical protein